MRAPGTSQAEAACWAPESLGQQAGEDNQFLTASCDAVARFFEAVTAEGQQVNALHKYAMHLLADYISGVALVTHEAAARTTDVGGAQVLEPAAADALKRGAMCLVACLRPADLQHLHVALGAGRGGERRQVLQALRKEWERNVRYAGKV